MAMEKYIKESLKQGYICPSTSLVASSFFFVSKKDALITGHSTRSVKFRYSLTLIPAVMEQLCGTNAVFRSAYNFICGGRVEDHLPMDIRLCSMAWLTPYSRIS